MSKEDKLLRKIAERHPQKCGNWEYIDKIPFLNASALDFMTRDLFRLIVDEQQSKIWFTYMRILNVVLGKEGVRENMQHIGRVFSQYAENTYEIPKNDVEAKKMYKLYICATTEFIAKLKACKSKAEFLQF